MKQAWIILGAIFAIVILILAIIIFRGGDSSTTDANTVPKTHLSDSASTDKVV
jgi:preprotein translocase subunit SecG